MLDSVLNFSLLALGFGFVIFWHELGHFLAAKYVGIKVEQFAVGFGQAVLSWRKGMGLTFGSSGERYRKLLDAEREGIQKVDVHSIGETEYRLNWIPLGGYVKMLGQDDMNPNAVSEDPRAYPQKSVGARMLVISAGVIMNIILAAILFMILFTMGHRVPPAIIGGIIPDSPAQRVTHVVDGKTVTTSLNVGDQILEFDGTRQDDWTKVGLTSALADPNEATTITVKHVDGTEARYMVSPQKSTATGRAAARGFLQVGVEPPRSLRAQDPTKVKSPTPEEEAKLREVTPADFFVIYPGDKIVSVDGQPLNADAATNEYYKLDRAIQEAGRAGGRTVALGVERHAGGSDKVEVQPRFLPPFGKDPLNFAGMVPRTTVTQIMPESPARNVLRPGDVIVRIEAANDPADNPTLEEVRKLINRAATAKQPVRVTVLREGKPETVTFNEFQKIPDGYGLGFVPGYDAASPIVAGTLADSAAAKAGIPSGATITSVNGAKVGNWYDVQRLIAEAPVGQGVELTATKGDQQIKAQLTLAEAERDSARNARYTIAPILANALAEQTIVRKASNPLQAAWWGAQETRDFILQFYVTIRRMFDGSVSYTNLMGPLGIFSAGTQFAGKGLDWLIWFLAMISANLAVVNFLPIPVVDGGHFVFLLLEKVQGKPVSQRMQSIAQVVGLALLLGVFLLVTYQDIARMINPY